MATYVIGDIQGCYDSLQRLLEHIEFRPEHDRLYLLGDLVNRGPKSLEVLRWARSLGDRVRTVLGNHDLYLLARAAGATKKKSLDTLDPVLAAPDSDELIEWLRFKPFLYRENGLVLVHAGLHPAWTCKQADSLASEVEALLRAADWRDRIGKLQCNRPPEWHPHLFGFERLRAITSIFVRLRACTPEGRMAYKFSGPPDQVPAGTQPWYAVADARWRDHRLLFGHWSALGLYRDDNCVCLDTGCVWGGSLSALRLNDDHIAQVPAAEPPLRP
ncbi:symmetrical bis(5'-nucleosyl)-tetraphosphatase [Haliangium ochraceum]|uniref:bis(5'-nucleosyl)-tetraphosphatase (symmetrical) n=1 Tax=Haliangium ochraceum (strain DSM 14365 / JCM 11303 / SMP-2) TaxID=502025 RepID=D0LK07_HALO1|nr:symmetrical bis(5'-nucleosyl)-tetraphosphatase [Haliangium ochraceum]ACY18514.1 bis(5'-nucleosyl)-tetraphosphatase(symmetrical) [Haliangium ochraceum DSM 14365]